MGIILSQIARIAEMLGDVCELAGRYEEAGAAYLRAREQFGKGFPQTRLMLKEGVLRERLGNYPEALDWYDRGLTAIDVEAAAGDGMESRVQLEIATAGVKFRQGRFDEGIEWSARAAEHAELAEDRGALGHAYSLMHLNHVALGKKDDEHARLALPLLEEAGAIVLQSNLVNNLGIEAYYAGRWDEASELYRRSGELSGRVGDVVNVARAQNNEGEILSDRNHPVGIALATSNLGRVAARARRFDQALELLVEALAAFEALGSEALARETEARMAECFVLAGGHQDALDLLPAAVHAAEEAPVLCALLERLHGYALAQARRPHEAGTHLQRSLELAAGIDADYEVALTLQALARTRLRGPKAEAEGQAILERLGVLSTPLVPLP